MGESKIIVRGDGLLNREQLRQCSTLDDFKGEFHVLYERFVDAMKSVRTGKERRTSRKKFADAFRELVVLSGPKLGKDAPVFREYVRRTVEHYNTSGNVNASTGRVTSRIACIGVNLRSGIRSTVGWVAGTVADTVGRVFKESRSGVAEVVREGAGLVFDATADVAGAAKKPIIRASGDIAETTSGSAVRIVKGTLKGLAHVRG